MSRTVFLAWMTTIATSLTALAMIWNYDLGVGAVALSFPGSDKQAGATYYSVAPGTEIVATVPVQNLSSNPSMPYRIEVRVGAQTVASENGSVLPSHGTKDHVLKWQAAQPGRFSVVASLTLLRQPLGSTKQMCLECKSGANGNCAFPRYCRNSTTLEVCSCHFLGDNPLNNSSQVSLEVRGGVAAPQVSTGPAAGVDLVVEGHDLVPSSVKDGVYEAHVSVRNVGADAAAGSFSVEVWVGRQSRTFRISGGLKPGESKSGMVEFLKWGTVRAVVDPRNEVRESNETNNSSD